MPKQESLKADSAAGSFRSAAPRTRRTIPDILARFVEVLRRRRCRHRGHPDGEPAARHRPALRDTVPRARRRARHRDGLRHAPRLPGAGSPATARGSERHLLHRRQPAPPLDDARRHAGRQADPRRNAAGVHVGGTSAGASILSEHMIAFGDEGSSPIAGSVRLAPGLGPDQPLHHRPAFPPARPARPPAHRAGLQPVRGRHRPRRGHRRLHRPGRDPRSRRQRRRHDRRCAEVRLLVDGQRRGGAARLHARASRCTSSSPAPRSTCTPAAASADQLPTASDGTPG